jgi:hypothetical protein
MKVLEQYHQALEIPFTVTPWSIFYTKAPLPQVYVTSVDFGDPVYALWFYCFKNFKLFDFPIFRF